MDDVTKTAERRDLSSACDKQTKKLLHIVPNPSKSQFIVPRKHKKIKISQEKIDLILRRWIAVEKVLLNQDII